MKSWENLEADEFQSTLPLRGATLPRCSPVDASKFQSTLPLRGATRRKIFGAYLVRISIHTPLAGSDSNLMAMSNFTY